MKDSEVEECSKQVEQTVAQLSERDYFLHLYKTTGYMDPSLYTEFGVDESEIITESPHTSAKQRPDFQSKAEQDMIQEALLQSLVGLLPQLETVGRQDRSLQKDL
eukprot:TRINITY_DN6717_c1_g1_i6.p1 TRINITY_DN6717_c1_g1~~TRINITY_DN6717_c1_g1_i6.p1  ORF type:complete len:105 (-),score=18.23 TRINITY_DN6717_c1_g1_i6:97-411(-)